jgi:membrane protein DedA with SNARE-associated domain
VFAAGVFEMRVVPYLLAVTLGRCVRFGVLAILTVKYGPGAVNLLTLEIHRHEHGMLTVVGLVVVGVVVFMVRKSMEKRSEKNSSGERDGEFEN